MHLEGSVEPDMMFELAKRNGIDLPWQSPEQLRAAYEFDDLRSFLNLYYQGCGVLQHERDFYDVTSAYLRRARAENVVHAEVFLGPQTFVERGVAVAEVLNGILSAIDEARSDLDMTAGLLVSAQRHRTQRDAFELLDAVQPWAERILGFGLGGAEVGNPPVKFAAFFAECRRQGFHVTAHAGEEGPAAYVREALQTLGVERIDHGTASVDDPTLMAELATQQTPLTVCPISNLKLKVVPSLAAHPLSEMLQAGLRVTVNSDDPSYFGSYVNENFWRCHDEMGLTKNDLVTMARSSFLGSFLPADEAIRHVQSVDTYAAAAG
ncbi:adenosine deaminase [Amycolatopsis cynarae]|uniref:Adenine deaminase n=2 Tax=Amycolatopsis cynarae TaxID=2995223 RepID=A0ABY7BFP0_9PSEU|nr:adenosine deaminase [Amycolatopsis sp. HUAS 11-8]WAL69691.1 adenosine deaminase [Amycolatopsis sp. HUAS 11-8]